MLSLSLSYCVLGVQWPALGIRTGRDFPALSSNAAGPPSLCPDRMSLWPRLPSLLLAFIETLSRHSHPLTIVVEPTTEEWQNVIFSTRKVSVIVLRIGFSSKTRPFRFSNKSR